MKRNTLLVIIGVGILVVGGYFVFKGSSPSAQVPQERNVDTSTWQSTRDEEGIFSIKYSSEFEFVPRELDAHGEGAFCLKVSNWKEAVKDKTGKTGVKNCAFYTVLANDKELDKFSADFFKDKIQEVDTGREFVVEAKDLTLLGGNAWLRAHYKEPKSGKSLYSYATVNPENKVVFFDASAMDEGKIQDVEDILSTVDFFFNTPESKPQS